jgi:hypothetical protein
MKYLRYLLLVFATIPFACAEGDEQNYSFCNVTSIDELPWLKSELEANTWAQSVHHAFYEGKEIVFIYACCPSCRLQPPQVKDCSGNPVGLLSVDIAPDKLVNRTVIWQSSASLCQYPF